MVVKVGYQWPSVRKFHSTNLLTKMSMPYYCGIPSLREKYWCIEISCNSYRELNEFASHADAETIMISLVQRNIERRAMPGSLKTEIVDDSLEAFIDNWRSNVA